MTIEERLQIMLGQRDFAIAALETQLEAARKDIDDLKKERDKSDGAPKA